MCRIGLIISLLFIALNSFCQTTKQYKKDRSSKAYNDFDNVEGAIKLDQPIVKSTETTIPFSVKDYPYIKDPEPTENLEGLEFNNRLAQPESDKINRVLQISIGRIIGVIIAIVGLLSVLAFFFGFKYKRK